MCWRETRGGNGYATEALVAVIDIAGMVGVNRLYALCHPDHGPSRRVLEKCDFVADDPPKRQVEFPNLSAGVQQDALCFALVLRSNNDGG